MSTVWDKLLEVLLVVSLTSSGQLLLRMAMRNFEATTQGVGKLIEYALHTPLLWVAVGLYGVSTLLWMRVLSRYPVGSVYPMVAIGYVLVTVGGILFLGEKVPMQGWLALTVICVGTLLLATTPWQSGA